MKFSFLRQARWRCCEYSPAFVGLVIALILPNRLARCDETALTTRQLATLAAARSSSSTSWPRDERVGHRPSVLQILCRQQASAVMPGIFNALQPLSTTLIESHGIDFSTFLEKPASPSFALSPTTPVAIYGNESVADLAVRWQAAAVAPGFFELVRAFHIFPPISDFDSWRSYASPVMATLRSKPNNGGLRAPDSPQPTGGLVASVMNQDEVPLPANVMYVRFSKSFLRDYLCQPFDRRLPVHDTVLGACVSGTSRVVGHTELELVENPAKAQATFSLRAVSSFQTTSSSGPIQIFSRGTTRVAAAKYIWFDGVDVLQSAAAATARTSTVTTGFSSDLPRLLGRISLWIARRRESASHALAERITSEHTINRVAQAFEAGVRKRTTMLTDELKTQYAQLPFDEGFPLTRIQCSTTSDMLQIVLLGPQESEEAFVPAPMRLEGHPDIEIQVHRALVKKVILDPQLRGIVQSAIEHIVKRPLELRGDLPSAPDRGLMANSEIYWGKTDGEWFSISWSAPAPGNHSSAQGSDRDR